MGLRRRLLIWAGSSTVAFVGFVGFAHTDSGRSLLSVLPGMGCPLDRGPLSAEQLDHSRHKSLAAYRGEESASQRTVLVFELGRSTRTEVQAWATDTSAQCEARSDSRLRCESGDAVRSFTFDRHDHVVALDVSRELHELSEAVEYGRQRQAEIAEVHGRPTTSSGELSTAMLSSGPLAHAKSEYRYSDLRGTLTATNMGHGRFVVRETWQAI